MVTWCAEGVPGASFPPQFLSLGLNAMLDGMGVAAIVTDVGPAASWPDS